MEAIILAGGKGTRLQSVVSAVPKPMAAVGGKPFLDYLLAWLSRGAVSRVVLSVGYMGDVIRGRYGEKFGALDILYSSEDEPLGTGGAIKKSLRLCGGENVFVINGDTFFDVDLTALQKFHDNKVDDKIADITIAVKEMQNFDRYGTVIIDGGGAVISFKEKTQTERGFINGGVYVIKTNIFEGVDLPNKFSFETEILHKMAFNIRAVPSNGNFIDIGIPEDYAAAQKLIPQWVSI